MAAGDNHASRLDADDLKALLDGGYTFTEQELKSVIEASGELIAITGGDGHFQLLNKQWERSLGWTREELRGKPFIEFVHPSDVEKTTLIAARMADEKTLLAFQNRYRCKDGSYRSLLWRGFFDLGTQRFYTATVDQTQTLASRATAEAFAALVEMCGGLVIRQDRAGTITRWDGRHADRFGWPEQDAVGRRVPDLLLHAERDEGVNLVALLDDCDDEDAMPARLRLPDGGLADVSIAAREFGDGLDPVVGVVARITPREEG